MFRFQGVSMERHAIRSPFRWRWPALVRATLRVRRRPQVASFAVVLVCVLSSGSDVVHAQDVPSESPAAMKTYRVTGLEAEGLIASLDRNRPRDRSGTGRYGLTTWDLRWQHGLRPSPGACSVSDFESDLSIEIVLPEWSDRGRAEESLRLRWDRFLEALGRHEEGHARIARAAAADLAARVARLPPAADCDAAEAAVRRLGKQVIEAARAGERRYDDETRHGATQGAIFE